MTDRMEMIAEIVRNFDEESRKYAMPKLTQSRRLLLAKRILEALGQAKAPLDACEFCLGAKGGVPGNENIIGGKVVCDYCHVLLRDAALDQAAGSGAVTPEMIEAAYREGHQRGRVDGSVFEVDDDWLASKSRAAMRASRYNNRC